MNFEDHAHCTICGRVVAFGVKRCSDECEAKYQEAQRYKKRQAMILVAVLVGTLLLFNLMRMGIL